MNYLPEKMLFMLSEISGKSMDELYGSKVVRFLMTMAEYCSGKP